MSFMVEYKINNEEYTQLIEQLTKQGFNYSNFPIIDEDNIASFVNTDNSKARKNSKTDKKEKNVKESSANEQPIFYKTSNDVTENIFFQYPATFPGSKSGLIHDKKPGFHSSQNRKRAE